MALLCCLASLSALRAQVRNWYGGMSYWRCSGTASTGYLASSYARPVCA